MAAPSNKVRMPGHGRLTVSDAVGTSLVIPFTRGDFQLGPLPGDGVLNEIVEHRARGKRVSEGYGDRIIPEGQFTMLLTNIVGADAVPPGTFAEFVAKQNAYATLEPTSGNADHTPKTWHLKWEIFGQKVVATEVVESVSMRDVHFMFNLAEADDGDTISWSFRVYGVPLEVRNAAGLITYTEIS